MSSYLEEAKKIQEELVTWRRHIHENPEIGHNLPDTTKYVLDKLKSFGIEGKEITKSGVVALVGKTGGKTIMLRADMDALEIHEDLALDFKSKKDGKMHACGHDMHTAMLLGAAKILKENEARLEGQVKLVFQPAEETLTGSAAMIEAGVLENPKVDFAVALHVMAGLYKFKTGVVNIQPGANMSGCQNYRIDIKGKGGHAGYPEYSLDPIMVGNHIYNQIQTIKMREVTAKEPLVLTFGQFAFGETHNVIPNEGVIQGTIRFFNNDVGKYAIDRIEEIVETTGKLFKCETKVTRLGNTPPLVNDPEKVTEVLDILKNHYGEEFIQQVVSKEMGTEDFAFVSQKVPSIFMPLLAGSPDDGYTTASHNPKTLYDEDCLQYGAAVMVSIATEWLKNNK